MPEADPPVRAVLGASVAVRWVVTERGSDAAAALLVEPVSWLAPRLLVTEVAAALRRKVAARELAALAAAQALTTICDAVQDGVIHLARDEDLASTALSLALALDRRVPDCIYVALAEREGASLATADRMLARTARGRRVPVLDLSSS